MKPKIRNRKSHHGGAKQREAKESPEANSLIFRGKKTKARGLPFVVRHFLLN